MKFDDIIKIKNDPFDIILGYEDDKNLIINIKENPSIIITGSTGTSKSILTHEILLQLINKNDNSSLKIIPITPTKVELNCYAQSSYNYSGLISDSNVAITVIQKLINERKELFKNNYVENFDSYNKLDKVEKLPFIIIAIDEATNILKNNNNELLEAIYSCFETGISIIMNTNDIYNDFFDLNNNEKATIRISFDFVSRDDALMNNIEECQNLENRTFLIEIGKQRLPKKYKMFEFNDKIIEKILK